MAVLKRAFSDTLHHLGRPQGIAMLVVPPVLGCLFLAPLAGERVMAQEWVYVFGFLAGVGVLSLAIFGWNLAAAPYRIQRDAAASFRKGLRKQGREIRALNASLTEAKGEIAEMQSIRPRLVFDLPTILGTLGQETQLIILTVRMRNEGNSASATHGWGMIVHLPNKEKVSARCIPLDEEKTVVPPAGRPFTFTPEEQIMIKTASPVGPGQIVEGILVAEVGLPTLAGCKVEVGCFDVHNRHVVGYFDIIEAHTNHKYPWSPHMNVRWGKEGEVPGE